MKKPVDASSATAAGGIEVPSDVVLHPCAPLPRRTSAPTDVFWAATSMVGRMIAFLCIGFNDCGSVLHASRSQFNDQWRIIFKWLNGEPHAVQIVDYH
jgi:hypothetical protein